MKTVLVLLASLLSASSFAESCKFGQLVSFARDYQTSNGASIAKDSIARLESIQVNGGGYLMISIKRLAATLQLGATGEQSCKTGFSEKSEIVGPGAGAIQLFNECTY